MEIWTQTDGTHNIYRDHSTTDYSITHFLIKHYMDPLSSFSSLKATSKKDRMMMMMMMMMMIRRGRRSIEKPLH